MKSALVVALLALSAAPPALADLALASAKNCLSCHAVDARVLGPSFKEIAARYKDNAGAGDLLATRIRQGGGGVWGTVKMPANTQVSEADAKKLAAWVLTVK